MPQEAQSTALLAIHEATALKQSGNEKLKSEDFEAALVLYAQAMEKLFAAANAIRDALTAEPSQDYALRLPTIQRDIDELRVSLLLNQSLAELKLGRMVRAEATSSQIVSFRPNNVKALFRRGQARVGLGKLDDALLDFERVGVLDPSNTEAKRELFAVHAELQRLRSRRPAIVPAIGGGIQLLPGASQKPSAGERVTMAVCQVKSHPVVVRAVEVVTEVAEQVREYVQPQIVKLVGEDWMGSCIGRKAFKNDKMIEMVQRAEEEVEEVE